MKVKFVLNGNPFYYGRIAAVYQPLHTLDNTTLNRPGVLADFVEGSQRPHIFLNPTESQGGQLDLPFFTPFNMIDIVAGGWSDLGQIALKTLQPLKHANGGTEPITLSIFVWAEDVHLSGLTHSNPSSIVPQAMEYTGIVSKPASAIAKVAGALSDIPVLSGWATATKIGMQSIAKMAALFGYSKPVEPKTVPFQPVTRQSMADTDGCENLLRLTADTKNELTIDPMVAGVQTDDELTIKSIASRESFLVSFPWSIGTAAEELLYNLVVDPSLNEVYSSLEHHMPACAFACMPLQYWRGSMKFRFQIVASGYHKGRLKFVYDPVKTEANSEYNVAYTKIVDIAESTDFCIEVGWGQTTAWREHGTLFEGAANHGSTALGYASDSQIFGNGTLAVYVVNELTSPNSVVNNDIEINVFISACDNFELAGPTDSFLVDIGFRPPVTPQSLEMDDACVCDPPTIAVLGARQSDDSLVNMIHMGETIASFRTLLKRYNFHEILFVPETAIPMGAQPVILKHVRPMFPLTPGYTEDTSAESNVIEELDTGNYVYARMTLMNYLTPAFGAWRGGIRYTSDTTQNFAADQNDSSLPSQTTWSVSRLPTTGFLRPDGIACYPPEESADYKHAFLEVNEKSSGISGVTRWSTRVNPVQSYEIPYYSKFRFAPAKRKTIFGETDIYQPYYELIGTTVPSLNPNTTYQYVAAGEDFSLMFYLCPPILFRVPLPDPTPPA